MKALLVAAAFWSSPALAADPVGDPMTVAEFEAYVTGHTLTYARDGVVWGAEQYLPGRQVIWAFEGGDCQRGTWSAAAGEQVCFTYEGGGPICWRFFKGAQGVEAQAMDDPQGVPLAELNQTEKPLICPGPEVGV